MRFVLIFLLLVPGYLFAQNDTCFITGQVASPPGQTLHVIADLVGLKSPMRHINMKENDTKFQFAVPVDGSDLKIVAIKLTYSDTTNIFDGKTGDVYVDNTRSFQLDVRSDVIPILLAPGKINIEISYPLEKKLVKTLSGPPATIEYEEGLHQPVRTMNSRIDDNYEQLKAARVNNADTVSLSTERKKMIAAGFEINRIFIRNHPSSIVSIQALRMMGNGDPTHANPQKELEDLFGGLSELVRSSKAGTAYRQKLDSIK